MINVTLDQRYRIDAELGKGGMGIVYRAQDLLLQRPVAVKILNAANLGAEGRTRLLNEAQAAARLNHPNIVTIYDAGEVDQIPYIVMEMVAGQSLHEQPPRDISRIIEIARQILAALGHAHANGIIHRDLKPENVLITIDGQVKLMDFGLARSFASRLSSEGLIVGTVFYMAPEMALGRPYDALVDLYALGVMLYELTARRLPFTAEDPISVISQHLYAPVVPPSTYNPDIPPGLEAIILQLLIKDPVERPASTAEVMKALDILAAPSLRITSSIDILPVVRTEPSLLARLARGRLVGREREFNEARTLWKQAAAGNSQVLLISGEPGIGKTRLTRELATLVEVTAGRALTGECYPEGSAPYAPIAQIVRQALSPGRDSQPTLTEWISNSALALPQLVIADLIRLAPDLAGHYPDIPANPNLDPQSEQQRLYESVFSLCEQISLQTSLLLIIEDAHWSDSGSLRMIRQLARRGAAAGLRLMILLTYREIELDRAYPLKDLLNDFYRERLATRLKLARLSQEETREMIQYLLQESITIELEDQIFQETEGNPFFVEEVCKALVEQGSLVLEKGHWQPLSDLGRVQIPQSVRLAIQSRAEQLSAQTQEVLLLASIIGRDFDFKTLCQASELDEDVLIEALEEAGRAQLVSEVRTRSGEERFSFTHALVPTTLREAVSGLRRHRLHRRVAQAVESLNPTDYATLAYHYDQAGDESQALRYYQKAAERARQVYANDEALRFYTQAIEFSDPGLAETFDLLAGRAQVYELVGRRPEQKADIDRMLGLAEQLNDPVRLQDAKIALIDYGYLVNPLDIIEPARLAVESAARLGDPKRQGQALFYYGEAERMLSHLPEARQALEHAAARFQEAGLPAQEARCYHTLALVFYSSGDYGRGRAYAETALQLSRVAGDRKQEAVSLRRLGLINLEQEHIDEAENLLREALALNRSTGDRFEETQALLNLGDCLMRQGQFEEVERLSQEALQISEAIQSYGGISRVTVHLEETFRHRGQFEAALRMVDEHIARYNRLDNLLLNTNLQAIKSDLLASIGQYEKAMQTAQPLLEFLEHLDSDKTQADVYSFMAWLQMNSGQIDRARQALDLALPKAELGGVPFILASVQMVSGELALRMGARAELEHGQDLVEQALQVLSTRGDKLRYAVALGLASRICLALGQQEAALAHSSHALQIADSIHTNSESEAYIYAHAIALHANGLDDQARIALQRAHERVLLVASNTLDDNLRQGWLEGVEINRAIQQAWLDWGKLESG